MDSIRLISVTPRRLCRLLCGLVAGTLAASSVAQAESARLPHPLRLASAESAYAIDLEGTRIVSGSPGESAQTGAVYLHECAGGQCVPAVRIVALDLASGDRFGAAVALSGDTLAVAAPGQVPGAVYVFVRSGSTWVQQARLNGSGSSAGFGHALDLTGDDLVVGADRADAAAGAVYVYTRAANAWSQSARLVAADAVPGDRLGSSVAIGVDTLIAGAPLRAGVAVGSHAVGAAYVFVRSNGSWSQQARLTAAAAANGEAYGSALSLDGERALIGAPLANAGQGSVYVVERQGALWTQSAQLVAVGGAAGDHFGWALDLAGDQALIGAPYTALSCGAAYRYRLDAGNWTALAGAELALPVAGNLAGWSVSLDGGRYAVGAPGYGGARDHQGAVYWFDPLEQVHGDGFDADPTAACVAL